MFIKLEFSQSSAWLLAAKKDSTGLKLNLMLSYFFFF